MTKKSYFIRMNDPAVAEMIKRIAADDGRKIGTATELLIKQEYEKRYGNPKKECP